MSSCATSVLSLAILDAFRGLVRVVTTSVSRNDSCVQERLRSNPNSVCADPIVLQLTELLMTRRPIRHSSFFSFTQDYTINTTEFLVKVKFTVKSVKVYLQ